MHQQPVPRAGLLACEQDATIAARFFGVRSGVDDGEPLNAEAGAIAAVGHFRVCLHVSDRLTLKGLFARISSLFAQWYAASM